jgi:hypothetical protein
MFMPYILVFSIIIKSLNLSPIHQWKIIYTRAHKQACKQIEKKTILLFLKEISSSVIIKNSQVHVW